MTSPAWRTEHLAASEAGPTCRPPRGDAGERPAEELAGFRLRLIQGVAMALALLFVIAACRSESALARGEVDVFESLQTSNRT